MMMTTIIIVVIITIILVVIMVFFQIVVFRQVLNRTHCSNFCQIYTGILSLNFYFHLFWRNILSAMHVDCDPLHLNQQLYYI